MVYEQRVANTFLMNVIFSLSSRPNIHESLLADGLNSERVCDKRVNNSSLAFPWLGSLAVSEARDPWRNLGRMRRKRKSAFDDV